jgi:hypothetical protein
VTLVLETTARNASCDATVDLIDVGAGTATFVCRDSGGTTLVTLNLPNPAFGAASSGVATALGVPISANAVATGTLNNYRVLSRGSVHLWSGAIGTSGAELIVDNLSITSGQTLILTSWTHTVPA